MSILDELLDHLVAGDEDKAKQLFHEIVVNQSRIEWNKKQLPEGDLIPLPQNSVSVDADATDYDFMRLGRNMANIATTEPSDNNMGDQDIMLNFFGGDKEAKHMIKNLKRLGYKVGDISGYQDHNFDPDSEEDKIVDPEDGDEVKEIKESVDKLALKAWYDKYSKYQSNNYDNLVFGMIKAWTDTGILSDAYEENEYAAVIDKFGDDKADSMDHDQVLKMMPISKAMQDDITKIMGEWQGEETMNKVDDMLQDLGLLEY